MGSKGVYILVDLNLSVGGNMFSTTSITLINEPEKPTPIHNGSSGLNEYFMLGITPRFRRTKF